MATVTASPNLTTTAPSASDWKFVVDRSDNGRAAISLMHFEEVGKDAQNHPIKAWVVAKTAQGTAISQPNAGWDDAIPYGAATYQVVWGGTFAGSASWKFDPYIDNPSGRDGIRIHQGSQATPSAPLEGCIGATAKFLTDARDALSAAGVLTNSKIACEVNNNFDFAINVAAFSNTIKEGEDTLFNISLTGPGALNGLSKEIFVRVDLDRNGTGIAKLDTDFTVTPSSPGEGTVKHVTTSVNDNTARYDAGWYFSIPAGKTSANYRIHANTDKATTPPEGNEVIHLTVNDYFVKRVYNGATTLYSDSRTQPGVLLKGALPDATVTITDRGRLLSEHLSGGIEGLQRMFEVNNGDTITFRFEAYSIPDLLAISDGTQEIGTKTFVSGAHTASMVAHSDRISVIVVGSSSGTAWDLDLTALPSLVASAQSGSLSQESAGEVAASASLAFDDLTPAAATLSAPASAVSDASLVQKLSQSVNIPGSGQTSPIVFNVTAGKDYFLRLAGREISGASGDIADGFVKVIEGGVTVLESHSSDVSGEPALFFHAAANAAISLVAGSDVPGQGGTGRIELYDASALSAPIVFLGRDPGLQATEGDQREIQISVYRFGDVSGAGSYRLLLTGSGSNPLSAADLNGGFSTITVDFDAGQHLATAVITPVADGVLEGVETGTVSIDPTSIPAQSLGNAELLGLSTGVRIEVNDGVDLGTVPFPIVTANAATGYETNGVIKFVVTLSEPAINPVSIAYTTADIVAGAGSDFVSASGNVVFAAGETSKEIAISLIDDGITEGGETFQLKLLNPAGVFFPGGASVLTVTGTIFDAPERGTSADTATFAFNFTDATIALDGARVIVDHGGEHRELTGFGHFEFADGTIHRSDGNPLVDDLFYYATYRDVWNAQADPDAHYNQFGWHEGRNPDAYFDTNAYLALNRDVKATGANPLTHYDESGWKEGRDPSSAFSTSKYLAAYPDVAAANVDPLAHFLEFGAAEGRQAAPATRVLSANGFDYFFYLRQNPDVAQAGVDPLQHFEQFGWREGRNPNALFSTNGYLAAYSDVQNAGINPLQHYHQFGWHEGRDPSTAFDTSSYLAAYPDVRNVEVNPLIHFLMFGANEGRSAFADGVWG